MPTADRLLVLVLELIEEPKRQPTFQFRAYQAVRFALR
jgi:hypothetical protein